MVVSLYALFVFLVHTADIFADKPRKDVCRETREEFGFALVGHAYKSTNADNFGRCYFECTLDERCQSATFLWNTNECKMKNETKKSRPADFKENPAATYKENSFRAKKGSKASVPGSSCKDILISGDAQGDGEYWIDPTASGNPFKMFCNMLTAGEKKGSKASVPGSSCKDILISGDAQGDGEYWIDPTASGDPFTVFCDMGTDGGGWTLINQFFVRTLDSLNDNTVRSNSYKRILPNYTFNKQYLLRNGFKQLKQDMGFTQIRFYCFKKTRGRVFHIMTNNDDMGANVVEYFTTSISTPEACGSFSRLPDDNSSLAENCDQWGSPTTNRWAREGSSGTDDLLFKRAVIWTSNRFLRQLEDIDSYQCDDEKSKKLMSLGDLFQILVR